MGVNFTISPSTVTSFVSSLMQSPPARNNALFSTFRFPSVVYLRKVWGVGYKIEKQ